MSPTAGIVADLAERPLRKDAERNRQLILEVAAQVFAEQGLDAGFDEIARRAGLGVGTVYRRFPDREGLVAALFEQIMKEIVELAEASLAMPDAWDGLTHFLDRTVAKQARDRGLKEVMASVNHGDGHLDPIRERLIPTVTALLDRAKRQGSLRTDIQVTDLAVLTTLISSVVTDSQPELWRRYVTLLLDALRERRECSTPLPMAAPFDDQVAKLVAKPSHRRTTPRTTSRGTT